MNGLNLIQKTCFSFIILVMHCQHQQHRPTTIPLLLLPPPLPLSPATVKSIVENCSRQPQATSECPILDRPDGGGYVDAYKRSSLKYLLPNHLQSIVQNRSRRTSFCKVTCILQMHPSQSHPVHCSESQSPAASNHRMPTFSIALTTGGGQDFAK